MSDGTARSVNVWLHTLLPELSESIVILIDRQGFIQGTSAGAKALFGWETVTAEKRTVTKALRLLHRSRGEDRTEQIVRVLLEGTGSVFSSETDLQVEDGARFPVQGSAVPVRDAQGDVLGGILTLRTQKAQGPDMERLLREYETIFQSSQSSMFIVAVDGKEFRYRRVNRAREMTAGLSEAEVVGRTPQETMGEEIGSRIEARMRECAESGKEVTYIADRDYPAGRSVFRVVLTPMIIDGQVVEIIGSLHDVTDLKVMAEKLQESQERYQAVFSNARDGIILYPFVAEGPAEKFSEANPAYEKLTGYSREELLGMTPADVLEPGQERQVLAFRHELIQHGSCTFEFMLRTKQGQRVPIGNSVRRISIGKREYVLAVARDISERKKAEAAMQYRLILEKAISETSRLLIGYDLPDFGDILAVLGKGADVSWAYFFLVGEAKDKEHLAEVLPKQRTWEWTAPGQTSLAAKVRGVPFERIGWLLAQLRHDETVIVEDVRLLPAEAAYEKQLLSGLGARSSLNVPVFVEGELFGFLGFVTLHTPRCWQLEDVELLTTVGRMIGARIEQQAFQAQIRYLSFYDQLTGLHNKAYFNEERKRIDTARQLPVSLIMGDVNGLKLVNDAFGHLEGDRLLQKVAEGIRRACRHEDIISRWGGDEFVVLLTRTGPEAAEEIAQRIREECEKEDGAVIRVTMATGTATKESLDEDMDDVLQEAEEKMYRQKIRDSAAVRTTIMSSLQNKLVGEGYEDPAHWERLRQLAVGFAGVLGLGVSELEELTLLCYLHDIGKLAVPVAVVRKPEVWSADEEKLAQRHAEAGYRIALASPQLTGIAEDILSHHEHWDGSGFPRGLVGREIPYISRVFTLINAYEYLTQDHPLRPALSEQEAHAQIRESAGSRFDPDLTEMFLSWQSSKGINNG